MASFRNVAPTAIISDALKQFETEGEGEAAALPPFLPSPAFRGARPGYYFSRGAQGVGYYLDARQARPSAAALEAALAAGEEGGEDEAGPSTHRAPARQLDPEELLREAEEAAGDDGGAMELLDARGLKRLATALERKAARNQELRVKYADQPDKFLESEVDLDEAVKSLLVVASSPELYPDLLATPALPCLLALLSHENSDIAADVVELLSELTDADAVEDAAEEATQLVDALLEQNVLELLMHRLGTFDERVPEEAAAVNNCLSIIENLIEVKPAVADLAVEKTKLLDWLLARLRPREADSNKQYASEILAILVQQSDANKRRMGSGDGIDLVLQAIAPYRNRDADTAEEEELVENLFDALCSCLMLPENKGGFVEAEGLELMLLVLKGKRAHRTGALKCIDFATTACPAACERLVDAGGLKSLFAIFMGKLKVKKQDEGAAQEEEERAVSIIANLLTGLQGKPSKRDRVAAKFVEAEFEKADRLMEVYFRYAQRVEAGEARLAEEAAGEDVDEDDILLARMDAGLYTLQQCALVLGYLWALGDMGLRKRVLQLLHQKSASLAGLRGVLLEYRANLGDEGGEEEQRRQVARLSRLLAALGHQAEEGEEDALLAGKQAALAGEQEAAKEAGEAAAAAGSGREEGDGAVEMEAEEEEGAGAAAPRAEVAADGAGRAPPAEEPPSSRRTEEEREAGERRRSSKEEGSEGGERRDKRRRSSEAGGEGEEEEERRRKRDKRSRSRERRRSRERGDRDRRRSRSRERRRSRSRSRERSGRDRRDRDRSRERRDRDRRRSRSRSRERR